MKEYVIKITDDGEVFINEKQCFYSLAMDEDDPTVDADKRALLSLADKMGYEATYLFEEMAYRLNEMLDEII